MNENPLLDAVDALTKPDTLLRHRGTEHDHFWAELVRGTTPEERAAAKKEKRKLPRTVGTGQWWCMFCDQTRDEKPDDVPAQTIDRHDDPPLLEQLETRIRGSLGDGISGRTGSSAGGSLIDTAAFNLHSRIRTTVRDWIRDLGGTPGKDIPTGQMVRAWYTLRQTGQNPVGEDDRYAVMLRGWVTEIRDILDPPDQVPYMGQPCPICGETRALRELEGIVEDTVALWAVIRPDYRDEGSYGLCKACGKVWRAHELIGLRQAMNGTATRLTHRVGDEMTSV